MHDITPTLFVSPDSPTCSLPHFQKLEVLYFAQRRYLTVRKHTSSISSPPTLPTHTTTQNFHSKKADQNSKNISKFWVGPRNSYLSSQPGIPVEFFSVIFSASTNVHWLKFPASKTICGSAVLYNSTWHQLELVDITGSRKRGDTRFDVKLFFWQYSRSA